MQKLDESDLFVKAFIYFVFGIVLIATQIFERMANRGTIIGICAGLLFITGLEVLTRE